MTRPAGLAAIALAVSIAAPAAVRGAQEIFRASTDLVLLSVSVSENKGRPVQSLGKDDFQVFEDGRPQAVTVFSHDSQPIAMSVLIDASVSMDPKMDIARRAATGFVSRLRQNDIAQIVVFQTMALIAQPFTGDKTLLQQAIKKTEAGGRTALYDAVYIALDAANRTERPVGGSLRRQVIVILSDGEDTASHKEYEDIIDLSKRTDAIIFAIGLRPKEIERGWNEAEFVLRTVTRQTGGRAFFVNEPSELPAIYTQIADELAGQYTLGYRSTNQKKDGLWRAVTVQIAGGNATARTKAGYYGPSKER